MTTICIFEDESHLTLLPLTWFRPVFDLRCGINTLFEKIKRCYPRSNISVFCRDYLSESIKKAHPEITVGKIGNDPSVLFINGRFIFNPDVAKKIPITGNDEVFFCDGMVVAARLSKSNLELVSGKPFLFDAVKYFSIVSKTAKITQIAAKKITYFFDLIENNPDEIRSDFSQISRGGVTRGRVHQTAAVHQRSGVFVDDGAEIDAFCVIDAKNGPVYISKNVKIQPYCRLEGPCFVGEGSVINTGANIRTGSSIGPLCKVGGEVEMTIFQGCSNKQHFGFLGHSYIGEWVNMGAGTTNSDLKNNYGNIKVHYLNNEIDSQRSFVGCAVADHTKIGIGALISTGAVIGAAANIYGGGHTQKFIPSFSWGNEQNLVQHDLEKALITAKAVTSRRGAEMKEEEVELFKKVFELTADERRYCRVN